MSRGRHRDRQRLARERQTLRKGKIISRNRARTEFLGKCRMRYKERTLALAQAFLGASVAVKSSVKFKVYSRVERNPGIASIYLWES